MFTPCLRLHHAQLRGHFFKKKTADSRVKLGLTAKNQDLTAHILSMDGERNKDEYVLFNINTLQYLFIGFLPFVILGSKQSPNLVCYSSLTTDEQTVQ